MASDTDVRQNLENIIEEIAALKMSQQRDELLLYGDSGVDLTGIKDRVKSLESAMDTAIKNINGMPQDVASLRAEVQTLIETDKKRVNFIKGLAVGYGLQAGGLVAVLIKIFS